MTEAEVVRQAMEGNRASFETLVRKWYARIVGYCYARTGSASSSEDLAQEVMIRAFRSLHTIQRPDRFGSWLCGIASHVCGDWNRSPTRREVSLPAGIEDDCLARSVDGRPDEQAENREERQRLLTAVADLPEAFRETLVIYYYDNVTYDELAEMLGVSRAAINARLTKARSMLRNVLAKPGR